MANDFYVGEITTDKGDYLKVTAHTRTGLVEIDRTDMIMESGPMILSSTDAHYLATLLRTAVDMIDFRAQLDAHR